MVQASGPHAVRPLFLVAMHSPGQSQRPTPGPSRQAWLTDSLRGLAPIKGQHQGRHVVRGARTQRLLHQGVGSRLDSQLCMQRRWAGARVEVRGEPVEGTGALAASRFCSRLCMMHQKGSLVCVPAGGVHASPGLGAGRRARLHRSSRMHPASKDSPGAHHSPDEAPW